MAYGLAYQQGGLGMALLTDTKARNMAPGSPHMPHGGVTGLVLHPSASRKGHGKWVLRFVSPVTGRRRNAGLGAYPDVGIAQAAKVAQRMRDQISQGIDPLEVKQSEATQPRIPTFEDAARLVHEELTPGWKNAKHSSQWINTLTEYATPVLGTIPLDQIQPRHIADALRSIWLSKPETASRVKQRIHAVMAWGWAHGYNQANPVDVVSHLLPLQPGKSARTQHQPAMPWRQLPAFIAENLAGAGELEVTKHLLFFVILTAVRSGEARGMTWEEVNLDESVWTIPAERMKTKQIHRVPLAAQAVDLIRLQQGRHPKLVFASPHVRKKNSDTDRPNGRQLFQGPIVSDMALTALLRRKQAPSDTPGRHATAHGFRSTFRDWCSENGVARDLAERSLAHTIQNKVEAAYHRTDLLDQRRTLMMTWAAFCCSNPSGPNSNDKKTS